MNRFIVDNAHIIFPLMMFVFIAMIFASERIVAVFKIVMGIFVLLFGFYSVGSATVKGTGIPYIFVAIFLGPALAWNGWKTLQQNQSETVEYLLCNSCNTVLKNENVDVERLAEILQANPHAEIFCKDSDPENKREV